MKTRTQDQKITYKKLDMVSHDFNELLEIGKTYKLGMAHCGYLFSHYVIVKITSVDIQTDYITAYGCQTKDGFSYRWNMPSSRYVSRIISAELI